MEFQNRPDFLAPQAPHRSVIGAIHALALKAAELAPLICAPIIVRAVLNERPCDFGVTEQLMTKSGDLDFSLPINILLSLPSTWS